ncbi:uncharacterized protein LOC133332681 [Musca vetustissima]|uniref:uncharacterized protein LOC133332681 n=1 Tax=Musca vetustissima TaxID=27455 RepID=UPI002AB75C53|nr:uncharacterized protein LOC133332681 [Musca vetustissima]
MLMNSSTTMLLQEVVEEEQQRTGTVAWHCGMRHNRSRPQHPPPHRHHHRHRYINTSSSLNNSTLEVTSSGGGGHCGENTSEAATTSQSVATAVVARQTATTSRLPRFVTLNCINGGSNANDVVNENDNDPEELFVNRRRQQQQHQRGRTPPPNYQSLSVTPPPSYSPGRWEEEEVEHEQINAQNLHGNHIENANQQELQQPQQQQRRQKHRHHHRQPFPTLPPPPPLSTLEYPALPLRPYQVPEVLGPGIDDNAEEDYVFLNRHNITPGTATTTTTGNRQSRIGRNKHSFEAVYGQVGQEPPLANVSYPSRNVATVSVSQQQEQQQQQRRRNQRRRKLHLLQQQHQQQSQQQPSQHHLSNSPLIPNHSNNNDTTDSDSTTTISDIDSNFIEAQPNIGSNRDQRRRRRQRLLKLRAAYCPDLLNACSLILLQQQQQQTSDSTVGSFTDSPDERNNHHHNNNNDDDVEDSSSDYVEIPYQRQQQNQNIAEISNRLNGITGEQQQEQTSSNQKSEEANQRLQQQEMGQNLSIRRPRISLTWVLREQQQQQQQQQTPNQKDSSPTKHNDNDKKESKDSQRITNNNQVNGKGLANLEVNQNHTTVVEKKRYRLKKSANTATTNGCENVEPLNGYATTPTSYTNASTALASQKFFSNQNLLEYHRDESCTKPPSKDLLFVCTPQRLPEGFSASTEALALVKKRNEIRKKLAAKMAQFRAETQAANLVNGGLVPLKKEAKASLKSGSYSEPSLVAASEGNPRRHRHRKRKERNRPPKFGYDIKNVDEFLTKCSLASPANIPMVLSTSCILYQTRPGGYQTEVSLPLGMVINAVFKNQNWLYVQTPHAEEGYVNYNTCLPLGILPAEARLKEGTKAEANQKPKACWETIGDVFPKPCGNMTDSEKEIHLRVGGTRSRSEGARTPHLKSQLTDNADTVTMISVNTDNTDCLNGNTSSIYGEQQVDKLYLRAASQPKLSEKTSYAQLKIIRNHSSAASATSSNHYHQLNDEYVTLQQQQQQQHKSLQKQHVHHLPAQKTYITRTFITNGHNGQHLHPKDMKPQLQQQQQTAALILANNSTTTPTPTSLHHINNQSNGVMATATTVAPRSILNAIRRSSAHCGQRQTLVAITTDYSTGDGGLQLQKGDIVTLCECRETKDHRQWFYVRTRDGRQGYIPAEVAGHGNRRPAANSKYISEHD